MTRQLLNYPLERTAFGSAAIDLDTLAETGAWLSQLLDLSKGMPGQLNVHVYDLSVRTRRISPHDAHQIAPSSTRLRPPVPWWPKRFHTS